jgi:hypothetical protein
LSAIIASWWHNKRDFYLIRQHQFEAADYMLASKAHSASISRKLGSRNSNLIMPRWGRLDLNERQEF